MTLINCITIQWHTHGLDAGHMGQWSGTLEQGLDGMDKLAIKYEKCNLLVHLDFVKFT